MRTKTLLLTAALTAAGALSSMAQVYSVNIVGYINLSVPSGFSMIANQLNATPNNTLETVIPAPVENTTLYKFNGTGYNSYNFSADNPGWFPAGGVLAPGEGAFISSPSAQTLTLVGEVQLVSHTAISQGFQILSSVIPQTDSLDNLLYPAAENDTAYLFDPVANGYHSYNFSADNPGWFPSSPAPKVGESFFLSRQASPGTWDRSFTVGP